MLLFVFECANYPYVYYYRCILNKAQSMYFETLISPSASMIGQVKHLLLHCLYSSNVQTNRKCLMLNQSENVYKSNPIIRLK